MKLISYILPRTVIIVLIICSLHGVSAQDRKVRLSGPYLTGAEIFSLINEQAGYRFAYDKSIYDAGQKVYVGNINTDVKSVLEIMFRNKPIEYILRGDLIVLAPRLAPFVDLPVESELDRQEAFVVTDTLDDTCKIATPSLSGEQIPITIQLAELPIQMNYVLSPTYRYLADKQPRFALKTNLLYAASTLTPNIAFEVGLTSRTTIDVRGSYNWIGRTAAASDNHKQRLHVVISPEYRWWLCERFNRHFFGVHLIYAKYNISGLNVPLLFDRQYRYDGHAFGAGVSYGYHLPLAQRWGAEFNLGVGYMGMNYERFTCAKCDTQGVSQNKSYFGPTRAGISLVYMFK